jgi:ABC-2 type transport system permease protein
MFHRIRTLVMKELQALLRDPQGRRLLIVPVILQLVLFPAAATLEVRNNTLAVLNRDAGAASSELLQRFGKAKAFRKLIMLGSEEEMRRVINERRALLVIQFPADFSRQLASGGQPSLQVILDGRRSNSGQIALTYLQQIIQEYTDELASRTTAPAAGASTTIVRHWFNPNLQYVWFIVPSLVAIITTVSTLVVTALSVAREREQGTFDQLLVSPLTPGMIMLGKAVPAFIVSTAQATIILLAGIFAYRIPFRGSLLLLYGSMPFYILALVGFGLVISSVCSTQQQAFLGVFSFMMPAVLLSGFVSPVENMPHWLQVITWANPLRHFIVIVKGVFLKDMGIAPVIASIWPLVAIAVVTLTAADIAFRRRLG